MSSVPIAVDAMGGDHAPGTIVRGALLAARELGAPVVLVGPEDRLREELDRLHGVGRLPISIVHAPDAVLMDESPLAALRKKPLASIKIACDLVASGSARAVVSAGHTGATLLAAHAAFGLIDGIERPALAVTVPTRTGQIVIVDAGANVDCRPEHLVAFGQMGSAYARAALGLPAPRVGLLSIGEEPLKGNDLVKDAHAGLSRARLNFIGNIDARALFTGIADVVVCDGFTGNIVLKVGEGLVDVAESLLRAELSASLGTRIGAWLSRPAFARFKRRLDYAERGGAPLLGVTRLALVGHGRSSARAIRNAVATAVRLADEKLIENLRVVRR